MSVPRKVFIFALPATLLMGCRPKTAAEACGPALTADGTPVRSRAPAVQWIEMTITPSQRMVSDRLRVLLDVEYVNVTDHAVDFTDLTFSQCKYNGCGPLVVEDQNGRSVPQLGVCIDYPAGYSPPGSGRWLCPGAILRVENLDISGLYDFPDAPQTLTFEYRSPVARHVGVRGQAQVKFQPLRYVPAHGPLEQRIAHVEQVGSEVTVICKL
jgi:hypothetical protein